jgi:hypothetical protein
MHLEHLLDRLLLLLQPRSIRIGGLSDHHLRNKIPIRGQLPFFFDIVVDDRVVIYTTCDTLATSQISWANGGVANVR